MQTDQEAAGIGEELIPRKTVVITGAASGIGKAAAVEFARRNYNIVAVARSEKGLNELVPECELSGAVVLTQVADVTDHDRLEEVARNAVDTFGRIDVWVNNAGVILYGRFGEIPYPVFRRVIDTNLFGCVHGARAALPYFREQGQGTLINVSSVLAKTGGPYASAYAISKAAIEALSDCLRMELEDMPGIHVCTVFPASIDTPLYENAANYYGRHIKPLKPIYRAEKVAEEIAKLAERPKREATVGASGKLASFISTIAPSLSEKAAASIARRFQFEHRLAPISDGNLFEPNDQWTTISGGWMNRREGTGIKGKAMFALDALSRGFGGLGSVFRKLSERLS